MSMHPPELWAPAPRTRMARALHDAADEDRRDRPEAYELDPDPVIAAAAARARLDPADRSDWHEGAERYLTAADDEGALGSLGRRIVRGTVAARLRTRVRVEQHLASRPEVAARPLDRPIVIVGAWRTGTTLLQRLLATMPALRAVYPAELASPWAAPDPGEATAHREFLDSAAPAQDLLREMNPELAAIHPFGVALPEECVLGMGTTMRSWAFPSTVRCPSYAAWLRDEDLAGEYRRYADLLRVLQDDRPTRWVLKAPAHTVGLDALLRVVPDAVVVWLHRDVLDTVTSGAGLFATFRSTYSDHVEPAALGEEMVDTTAHWYDVAMSARRRHLERGGTLLDVAFAELVADPIGVATRLAEIAGVDPGPREQLGSRLADLDAQHHTRSVRPEHFAIDRDAIPDRFAVYLDEFGHLVERPRRD